MKYILMTKVPKKGHGLFVAWTEKEDQANIACVKALNQPLAEWGEFVAAEGLAFPNQAKLLRA